MTDGLSPEIIAGLILQLPIVAVITYAFVSGKVRRSGEVTDLEARHEHEVEQLQARHTRELDYLEARRSEEREGRIAAERRVSELTERWDRAIDLLSGVEKELIRSGRRDDAP